MGRSLVIKDTDFSAVRVEQVGLYSVIPCTGITINLNQISFEKVGSTATIVATVTPANTSDQIIWSSTNENVVTVANGVVTQVGVGHASIIARCGEFTAECAVSAVHIMHQSDLFRANGYGITGPDLSLVPPRDAVYEQASARHAEFADLSVYQNNPAGVYRAFADLAQNPGYNQNAIKIPLNAQSIKFEGYQNADQLAMAWERSTEQSTYYTGRPAYASVKRWDAAITFSGESFSYPIAFLNGADSLVFAFRSMTGQTGADIGEITITFS